MVERSLSMREVQGSIPCISTHLLKRRKHPRWGSNPQPPAPETDALPLRHAGLSCIEPSSCGGTDSNLPKAGRRNKSGPWSCWGSNPGPSPYQSDALPTELHDRCRGRRTQAVKGVDSKSTGLCPRRFESCRLRLLDGHRKSYPWWDSNPQSLA